MVTKSSGYLIFKLLSIAKQYGGHLCWSQGVRHLRGVYKSEEDAGSRLEVEHKEEIEKSVASELSAIPVTAGMGGSCRLRFLLQRGG